MKKRNILGVSLALLLASAASSQAVAIIVQNQSFESPGGNNGDYPAATSWVGSTFTEVSTAVGLNGGHLDRYNGQNGGTAGSQNLGVGFLANTVYTLTILIGNRTSDSSNPTGTARFGLTAGGTEQGTFTEVTNAQVAGQTFQDFNYTFTTGAVAPTGDVGITLGASGGRGLFDNVRLDASAIPEPSTALCAMIGGLALLRRRRR